MLTFEWDELKDRANIRKHRVSFDEAKTVFNDPAALTLADPDHSLDEERYLDLGLSTHGALLVVSYTERSDSIRIISCRKATRRERMLYEAR